MRLRELIDTGHVRAVHGALDVEIANITTDSRAVAPRALEDARRLVGERGDEIGCTDRACESRGLACPECKVLRAARSRSSAPERRKPT